jgi:hypothetical protein
VHELEQYRRDTSYILPFDDNNGYANAPGYYVYKYIASFVAFSYCSCISGRTSYILPYDDNNGYANAPEYYVYKYIVPFITFS